MKNPNCRIGMHWGETNRSALFSSLLILFLLLCNRSIASATTYYVSSSSGSDKSGVSGRSASSAWKSLNRVNGMSFKPGDSVLLKRGDVWRETLKIPSSGANGSYITFSTYGEGKDPLIYGSDQSGRWKRYNGKIWISVSRFDEPHPNRNTDILSEIFFIGSDKSVKWGNYKTDEKSLAVEMDWTWSGKNIYVYSTSDPSAIYSGIEIPQRQACIDLNGKEYISISGVDLSFSKLQGVTCRYPMTDLKGLKIENCKIAYIGGNIKNSGQENGFGIDAVYSDMTVRNCEIHNCGRRGISLCLYASGYTVRNVLIEQNIFHDGHHTTGIDISAGSGTYTASLDGVVIRRNLFYDLPSSPFISEQIFVQNQKYTGKAVRVMNIRIYSNIFKYPSHSAVMAEGCENMFICNNTFYNHNISKSMTIAHIWIDANCTSVIVKNNIFYTELDNDLNVNGLELFSKSDAKNIEADNNLYYRINNKLRMIFISSAGYRSGDIEKIRSVYGWEKHSPAPANPLFVSPDDFHLKAGSPAIGKGTDLDLPFDFYGKKFNAGTPSIGACEYEQKKPVQPVKSKK
jgi:hypothetical protein